MRTFIHKPQSVVFRRVLFQIHLWSGIGAALYVFLVCVTGAALMFRIDMQKAIFPHLFTPTPGSLAEPGTILDAVAAAYPDAQMSGIDAPTTARPTYLAYVTKDRAFKTVLVDPVTARVLGELPESSFIRTIQDLHFDLLGGRTGRVVNGVGGMVLLVLALTGLVIWWPGLANWKRSLTIDWRRGWKRVNWDLHSATGFWTLLLVAMWALTGIYFAFPSQFRATVNSLSPLTIVRAPSSNTAPAGTPARDWHRQLADAMSQAPGLHVARVVVPSGPRAAFHVLFSDRQPTPLGDALTSVYLDQYTGRVLASPGPPRRSAGDVIMAWVAPLHVGNFGGPVIKWSWFVLGLAPALLAVTGAIMWWTRVVRPWQRGRLRSTPMVARP